MHQMHHLLYTPCFTLEGCNRYKIIKCGYVQYAKQVYDVIISKKHLDETFIHYYVY